MAKKVLKFGGTSVGSIKRILHAAKIIKKEHDNGNKLIVVVSAMAGTTNNLVEHSKSISKKFNKRELDVLLTSGEQVTSALIAGALNDIGVKSKSWMNWQIPILTEGEHTNSRIIHMNVKGINDYVMSGGVAVVPGFQGVSKTGDITSIGRGGDIQKYLRSENPISFLLGLDISPDINKAAKRYYLLGKDKPKALFLQYNTGTLIKRGEGCVGDHIDRNKSNNHVSNLRWCSREENMAYAKCSEFDTNQ